MQQLTVPVLLGTRVIATFSLRVCRFNAIHFGFQSRAPFARRRAPLRLPLGTLGVDQGAHLLLAGEML